MRNDMHACESIPNLHTPVIACGDNAFPVRRPGHVKYRIAMTMIGIDMIASSRIPHLDCVIYTTRDDMLAIGRPGYSTYVIRMATVRVMHGGADKMHDESHVGTNIGKEKEHDQQHEDGPHNKERAPP